ncbi:MAG: immunoglobulin domain-containing protein, partial [Candidatus Kapaibacterium sp.]
TYFGGSADDIGRKIRVDSDGTTFIAGESKKETGEAKFPISDNAYSTQIKGGFDCFLAKIDIIRETGSGYWKRKTQELVFSTFFGGRQDDFLTNMKYDYNHPFILFSGYTKSNDFPVVKGNNKFGGGTDGFFVRFSNDGSSISNSELIGGAGEDRANSVAYDQRYDYYVCGSAEAGLKTTENAYQKDIAGEADGFIVKNVKGSLSLTAPSGQQKYCPGTAVDIKWSVDDLGNQMNFSIRIGRASTEEWLTIAENLTETSYNWTVPPDLAYGTDYQIQVIHPSGIKTQTVEPLTILEAPIITSFITQPEHLTLCEGESLQLIAAAKGANINFRWYYNNQIISNATDSIFTIESLTPDNTGNYKLVVSNECSPDATSDVVTVEVIPTTSITADIKDTTVIEHTCVTFHIEAEGQDLEYEWFKDGNPIIGETNKFTIVGAVESDEGVYKCVVTGRCGTAESSEANLVVDPDLSVSPGSSFGSDLVSIEITGGFHTEIIKINVKSDNPYDSDIYIADINGQRVADVYAGAIAAGDNYSEFNTASLSPGVYWVVVRCGSESAVQKFQVIR